MKKAFPPIVFPDSKILLLGTMPGEESLRKGEYYANKNNQFWKILYFLFQKEYSDDYSNRKLLLEKHCIALWDVLAYCNREGSLDSNIVDEIPNNFASFYSHYPQIKKVYFTSRNARQLYVKYVGFDEKEYFVLPSPSGTYARMRIEEKLKRWSEILMTDSGTKK